MDKETLSNYGWIVICVLVLAVMIALATPFGTFVADGFKATYTGLFQTGDSALDVGLSAVGVSNKLPCGHERNEAGDHTKKECGHYNCQDDCGCVPAACGVEGHWSGDGMDHTTRVNHTGHTYACQCASWSVPEGATYIMWTSINGKKEYTSGEELPCGYLPKLRDNYLYGDYKYALVQTEGWNVAINTNVTDKNQKTYGEILDSINGTPVIDLNSTFEDCTLLETSPAIPSSIKMMQATFENCTSLIAPPDISNCKELRTMANTFLNCKSLTDLSEFVIPNSVTTMDGTFWGCTSLTKAPAISTSLVRMDSAFYNCSSLVDAPAIPSTVENMYQTFDGCTSLVVPPDMSNATGLKKLDNTFEECSSLKTAPNLSNSTQLETMHAAFNNCKSLLNAPDLSNCTQLTDMSCAFKYCRALTTGTVIPSSVTDMGMVFYYCTSLTGTVTINATPTTYGDFLGGVDMSKITLTGDAPKEVLNLIGATGYNWTPIE